jgi:hypothetical protein
VIYKKKEMAQSSPQKKSLNALSFEELAILNERKEAIKKDHFNYVESHPELKTLMSSFMSAILIEKPDDVLTFAIEHFSTFKPAKKEV